MNTKVLVDRWYFFYEFKQDFYNGYDEINIKEFTDLIQDTYSAIKEMRQCIDNKDYANFEPNDIYQYIEMVSVMARYGELAGYDDSEKYIFTATGLLTSVIVSLVSANSWNTKLKNGIIETCPGEKYGVEKKVRYNVNDGDLSGYLEIADEMMK